MGEVDKRPLVLLKDLNGVRTITFNRPEKLNGWSPDLMAAVKEEMQKAAQEGSVQAVVLTGSGKYYCAGVDFAGSLTLMAPSKLKAIIAADNEALFNTFMDFPKPLIISCNGPAIGAAVTSANLADAIICSDSATFLTPFKALGICPEGCSSLTFPQMFGEDMAKQILEGRKLGAEEAMKLGMVRAVFPTADLENAAQKYAEEWIASGKGKRYSAEELKKLHEVNKRESIELAECLTGEGFLNHMVNFSYEKSKWGPYFMFSFAKLTRPLWSKL